MLRHQTSFPSHRSTLPAPLEKRVMSRLYPVHWKTFEKFLFKMGCEFVSQKGSHRKYYKAGIARPIIVTVHGKGEHTSNRIFTHWV